MWSSSYPRNSAYFWTFRLIRITVKRSFQALQNGTGCDQKAPKVWVPELEQCKKVGKWKKTDLVKKTDSTVLVEY